jgi:UDP-N-acetylglucosamine 2-epimerase
MKILLYADWPLASTYLDPLYNYFKINEPSWSISFAGNHKMASSKSGSYDVVINCDERSSSPRGNNTICIFHGLASKGQAFSTARRDDFVKTKTIFAVPGKYYEQLLLDMGVPQNRIFVSGLTKHDGMNKKILYAPTHNKELSAIPVIKNRIYEISNVKIHLHQWTKIGKQEHHKQFLSYYPEHETEKDICKLLCESDVVIGDFGSIVLEAIVLGKQAIQIVNPGWENWYKKEKKLSVGEIDRLPEIYLAKKYAIQAYSMDDVLDLINLEENIGNASEKIRQYIKTSLM